MKTSRTKRRYEPDDGYGVLFVVPPIGEAGRVPGRWR